jgi:hypothetical protein
VVFKTSRTIDLLSVKFGLQRQSKHDPVGGVFLDPSQRQVSHAFGDHSFWSKANEECDEEDSWRRRDRGVYIHIPKDAKPDIVLPAIIFKKEGLDTLGETMTFLSCEILHGSKPCKERETVLRKCFHEVSVRGDNGADTHASGAECFERREIGSSDRHQIVLGGFWALEQRVSYEAPARF